MTRRPPALLRAAGLLLALALLPPAGLRAARAGDEPQAPAPADARAQVARWLVELTSPDYHTREAARAGLQRLGLQARDLLEAARDAKDPEVRRTVRAILDRVPAKSAPADAVAPGDFAALGRVTLDADDAPLGDLLTWLGRPVGARLLPPQGQAKARATLHVRDVPFYDALDELLRARGLRLAAPLDATGSAHLTSQGERDRAPRAAAGPMQLTLVEVAATRSLEADVPPRYALTLRLEWPPFVQLAQFSTPDVESARDPDGHAYKPSAAMSRRISQGVSASRRHHELQVHLVPADPECKPRLAELALGLPLILRSDRVVVEVGLDGTLPRTVGPDGKPAADGSADSVCVTSVEEAPGGHGQWIVAFRAVLADPVAQRTLQGYLLEPDGAAEPLYVYGGRSRSADGTVRIRAQAWRGPRGRPRTLRVVWFRREEAGRLGFRLRDLPLR